MDTAGRSPYPLPIAFGPVPRPRALSGPMPHRARRPGQPRHPASTRPKARRRHGECSTTQQRPAVRGHRENVWPGGGRYMLANQ